jgi:ribosomal protein S6
MQYELFYLVGASKEADLDKIKKEISDIVTAEGGVFEEKQVIEKRKMAYEIRHENRGFYVAQRFNLEDSEKMQLITQKLGLYTEILRSIITRTEELPELTSREERGQKSKTEQKVEIKKEKAPEPKPAVEKKEEDKKEPEEKLSEEDIDKKLEEILNI